MFIFWYRYVRRVCMALMLCNVMVTAVIMLTELTVAVPYVFIFIIKNSLNYQKYFSSSLNICLVLQLVNVQEN